MKPGEEVKSSSSVDCVSDSDRKIVVATVEIKNYLLIIYNSKY